MSNNMIVDGDDEDNNPINNNRSISENNSDNNDKNSNEVEHFNYKDVTENIDSTITDNIEINNDVSNHEDEGVEVDNKEENFDDLFNDDDVDDLFDEEDSIRDINKKKNQTNIDDYMVEREDQIEEMEFNENEIENEIENEKISITTPQGELKEIGVGITKRFESNNKLSILKIPNSLSFEENEFNKDKYSKQLKQQSSSHGTKTVIRWKIDPITNKPISNSRLVKFKNVVGNQSFDIAEESISAEYTVYNQIAADIYTANAAVGSKMILKSNQKQIVTLAGNKESKIKRTAIQMHAEDIALAAKLEEKEALAKKRRATKKIERKFDASFLEDEDDEDREPEYRRTMQEDPSRLLSAKEDYNDDYVRKSKPKAKSQVVDDEDEDLDGFIEDDTDEDGVGNEEGEDEDEEDNEEDDEDGEETSDGEDE